MKIRLLAFGTRMPRWVEQACGEYRQRLPAAYRPQLVELATAKRGHQSPERALADEDQRMLSAIRNGDHVIALDQGGKSWTTEQFTERFKAWQLAGRDVCLLVGGPEGLGSGSLARAEQRWSLSALTLPHALVRVLLFEQFYRAWSLQQGHPYHK